MANKHMNICPTSLVIKAIHIKITMSHMILANWPKKSVKGKTVKQ